MPRLERDLARAVDRYLKTLPKCYAVNYTGGGRAGAPDRLVCYEGRFIGLELKSDTGRPSELQKVNLERIRRAGGEAFVVRSLDEVRQILTHVREGRERERKLCADLAALADRYRAANESLQRDEGARKESKA